MMQEQKSNDSRSKLKNSLSRRSIIKQAGALSATGSLALAGCTGDGDGGGTTTSEGDESTTESSPAEWSITGATEGSPANAWVQAMAAVMEENSDQLNLETTLMSDIIGALQLLSDGDEDLAYSNFDSSYQAQNNLFQFSEDGQIGDLDPEPVPITPVVNQSVGMIITRADQDDIETIDDLDGKRISTIHPPNSGNHWRWYNYTLEAAGVEPSSFEFMGFQDTANAIQSGQIDAGYTVAINQSNIPGTHQPLFQSTGMKGVEIPTEYLETAKEEYVPGLNWVRVGSENLNVEADFDPVNCFFITTAIHTSETKDDALVKEYLSTMIEHQEDLGEYHAVLEDFGLGDDRTGFAGVIDGVKFHPAAVEYYREAGHDYFDDEGHFQSDRCDDACEFSPV